MSDDAFFDPADRDSRRDLFFSLEAETHVWLLDPDSAGDDACLWCEAVISAEEGDHHRKFLREADARAYLLARGFVRAVLSRYADVPASGWSFAKGAHNRPEIASTGAPPGLRFNLSHTRGCIALLVHGAADAGIDVERLGRVADPAALSQRFFTPEEHASLISLPARLRDLHFVRLWTLKEAYVKARGLGLARNAKKFWIEVRDSEDIQLHLCEEIGDDASDWTFTATSLRDQYVLATAARRAAGGNARVVRHLP